MGVPGGDVDPPPVQHMGRGRTRGSPRLSWRFWPGRSGGRAWLTPDPPPPSSEWPREPQLLLYVPKFHSGWEPPLDVLREAPWEVEGLAAAPGDEVRAPPTRWPHLGCP